MDILKFVETIKQNPLKGAFVALLACVLTTIAWFASGYLGEKGKQLAESKVESVESEAVQSSEHSKIDNGKSKSQTNLTIYEAVKRSTVAIALYTEKDLQNPYTIIGSGFCIHPRGIIVTSRHVIDAFLNKPFHKQPIEPSGDPGNKKLWLENLKAQVPYAIFFDVNSSAEEISVALARFDYVIAKVNYDLAVARVHPHIAYPDGFPSLQIESYKAVHEGMEIATCGFPLGNFLEDNIGTMTSSFTKGILSSVVPSSNVPKNLLRGFQLDLTATHGNSGGPVFSIRSGKVLGVLQGGIKSTQGLTIAQPIWPVVEADFFDRILNGHHDMSTN
jgi:S1-C subfamily serine protease